MAKGVTRTQSKSLRLGHSLVKRCSVASAYCHSNRNFLINSELYVGEAIPLSEKVNNNVKDFASLLAQAGAPYTSQIFTGIAGTVAPGLIGFFLGAQQVKLERNFRRFEEEVLQRVSEIESLVKKNLYAKEVFEIMLDYLSEEKQVEKVKYLVEGLQSALSIQDIQKDLLYTFYDTMASLRIADIAVLRAEYLRKKEPRYANEQSHISEVAKEFALSDSQVMAIRVKLVRMGLLVDSTIDVIIHLAKSLDSIKRKINSPGFYFDRPSGLGPSSDGIKGISNFGIELVDFFKLETE